jgi:S1-C subfamily serine protease
VNPGNSGGPLVNVRGELVGMNVAIATGRGSGSSASTGQSAGISFAIPLGVIESVVEQIVVSGQVRRGFLGITADNRGSEAWTADVVDLNGNFVARGVRVATVTEGLAAYQAGIRPGDIITEIGGEPVNAWHTLRSIITTARPGSAIPIKVWRNGEPVDTVVNLAQYPEEILQSDAIASSLQFRLGVRPDERRIGEGRMGVVFAWVAERGDAFAAGFRSGDVVVAVAGEPVGDLAAFFDAMARAEFVRGKPVRITISRGGSERELSLRLGR